MQLIVNLGHITANAAHAKAVAALKGAELIGVIKSAYSKEQILRAFIEGGVEDFGFSTLPHDRTALDLTRKEQRSIIMPSLAGDAGIIAKTFCASVHSTPANIAALGAFGHLPHQVYITVATSDNREGVNAADITAIAACVDAANNSGVSIAGIIANFGCQIEAPPSPSQIAAIEDAVSALERLTGIEQCMSLGGSVCLQEQVILPRNRKTFLRVGEAIIAGSIPGSPLASGFKRPFRFEARVLEAIRRDEHGQQLALINVGWTHLHPADITFPDCKAHFVHVSGECAVLQMSHGQTMEAGDVIVLDLGYKSLVQALLNPATKIVWTERC